MKTYAARVRDGRIVLDKPRKLPEGAVLEVTLKATARATSSRAKARTAPRAAERIETLDDMDPDERAALEASLDRAEQEHKAGLGRPAAEIIARLEAKHRRR